MRKVRTTSEGKCIKYIHRNICNELLQIDRVVDQSILYIIYIHKNRDTRNFSQKKYFFFFHDYFILSTWEFISHTLSGIIIVPLRVFISYKKILKCKNISCKFNLLLFNKIVFCNFLMYLCLFIVYRHDRTKPWLVGRYYLLIILN